MPRKDQRLPGYVYKTAAIPEAALPAIEAFARRIRVPVSQAIGLLTAVATGPTGPALIEAHQAPGAKGRELVVGSSSATVPIHKRLPTVGVGRKETADSGMTPAAGL
jgi:hypothetical protein